ncbi:MAG: hypothetical protein KA354_02120 [Phycisphaerae bacterium]|nr:hypothetical protein [Phycisphaerae bacterium]
MWSFTESRAKTPEGRLQNAMQDIATLLKRLGETEALSRFNAGLTSGPNPSDATLLGWLAHTIGPQATLRVIASYARQPCFCCHNGLEPCDSCDGRGHSGGSEVCVQCLGLGAARCDFCAGSGLVTYDAVPHGLQVPVALRRMKDAVSRVRQHLDQPLPRVSDVEPISSLRQAAKALSDLNRALGVFENGLLFSKDSTNCGRKTQTELAHVVRSSVQCTVACRSRMRELIEVMAGAARLAAESVSQDARHRAILLEQARFYDSCLGRSDPFAGTGLEHPYLDKAVAAPA